MGDNITRPANAADLARAKLLREALRRRTPNPKLAEATPAAEAEFAPASFQKTSPKLSQDSAGVEGSFLEQLLECVPEALSILDGEHRVTRLNREFTRMFGYRPEEALGQTLQSLILPPDRTTELRWIQETHAKGQKVSLETKRRRKDGTLVDVLVSSAAVVVDGKRAAVCVLYRDITEQKRAETISSALYRIAEKTSLAQDLQQFYAAIHGIVGELMYAHNFYIAIYDPLTQTLSFPYFVDEEDPAPARKKLGRGLTEYVLRKGESLLCTPEVFETLREQNEVELIGAASLDWLGVPLKAGNNTFGVLVVQSYTGNVRFGEKEKEILTYVSQQVASAVEHKHNEEALRRSEARYRSLVQSAVYGIFRFSLGGTFLDVNPALITMLGYESAEELLNLDPKHDVFLDPGEQERLIQEFQRGTRLDNIEVRWKRKDGNAVTLRLSGRVVKSADKTADVLEIIAEDVTERRVLENQFRQAQKMEAVGRLAGGVAHDFNNLLMVISGYTEVLLENTGNNNPLYPKIEAIYQATERATGLTRQLLAFSRRQMLELKVVDVNVIVGGHGAPAVSVDRGKH